MHSLWLPVSKSAHSNITTGVDFRSSYQEGRRVSKRIADRESVGHRVGSGHSFRGSLGVGVGHRGGDGEAGQGGGEEKNVLELHGRCDGLTRVEKMVWNVLLFLER